MAFDLENWRTQIRKGYLELCLLRLIRARKRLYGFEILDLLDKVGLQVKEGTLYPVLNRMTVDGTLTSSWETENLKGHPRKFYSLTAQGEKLLKDMSSEYGRMNEVLTELSSAEQTKSATWKKES